MGLFSAKTHTVTFTPEPPPAPPVSPPLPLRVIGNYVIEHLTSTDLVGQPFWIYDLLLIVAGDADTFVFSCSTIDDAITLVKALNERDAKRGAVDGSTAR